MAQRLTVMISSTVRDLPEHREEVKDACLRQGMFPSMMEHLPATDAEAISASLKLVDEADIYVGVFAHRYGYVPKANNPKQMSITEMEYNRAVDRKIPRAIFVMGKGHLITADDVEIENAAKLKALKERVQNENIVNFFKSPPDLRAHCINSLSQLRVPDLTAFHYVSDIPKPPDSYIAHPYTLLQARELIGRQAELNLLTDWVAKPSAEVHSCRIFNFVAVGGMGKSALTWKWFNDIAPKEMKNLAGRMWWSFYESDATFENFIIRALAYVTGRAREDIERNTRPGEREEQLLSILDGEPFLVTLDGLERILVGYARMDANRLIDDQLDQRTANYVTNALGLPESVAQSFGQHLLRKSADPRAGNFLRKLTQVHASRILINTRLYPADLQAKHGEPIPGSFACFLNGLSEDDAISLWRSFGVSGSREELLRLFFSFDCHPLLIQALASEIAQYRRAPGDFDQWREHNPDFNPFSLPLVQTRSHVLSFALRGVQEAAKRTLDIIAAFRMPASYDTLTALLIGKGKPCADERELDSVLADLEDRGLVGWDKRANRYDLHPLVRGVVWSGLTDREQRGVYGNLRTHFKAFPKIDDWMKIAGLEELSPAIELYNTLIGLARYDDAFAIYYQRLEEAAFYRLGTGLPRIQLLEMLFRDGECQLPRLRNPEHQAFTLNALALGYDLSGQPGRAASLYRRHNEIRSNMNHHASLSAGLGNLSDTLRLAGALRESESAVRLALVIARSRHNRHKEGAILNLFGLTLAARGIAVESESALRRALRIFVEQRDVQAEGVVNRFLAQRALWMGEFAFALSFADRAWNLAQDQNYERDFIRAAQRQGAAGLGLHDFPMAEERLNHALTRARQVNPVEEELPVLIALAELLRRQGKQDEAREFLSDIWEYAERGPYPLFHADACNVLAQIERDARNLERAIAASSQAYRLAWCDGPPFAYHWGLLAARKQLQELGAPEPEMPLFNESKFEPMPEVEIDPRG